MTEPPETDPLLDADLHPLYDALLPEILTEAEGGKTGLVVALDDANSGLSVGRYQMDLSQRRDLAAALGALARAQGWAELAEIELIDRRTRDLLPDERRRGEAVVRRAIETAAGAEILAAAEAEKLVQLRAGVSRLRAGAADLAAEFLGGLRGQIELACHLHQFGTGSTKRLAEFLDGGAVRFAEAGLPPREVRAGDPLDLAGFRAFRAATRWGHLNERARLSRDARIDRAYKIAVARVTGGDPNSVGLDGVPERVRRVFERDAAARGAVPAIKRLQRAISATLAAADPATVPGPRPRLTIDGVWGPLSRAGLGRALALTGADGTAVAKRLALDIADEALRAARRGGEARGLDAALEALTSLGPAAAAAIRTAAGERATVEGATPGPEATRRALARLVSAVGVGGLAPALYGQPAWRELGAERGAR